MPDRLFIRLVRIAVAALILLLMLAFLLLLVIDRMPLDNAPQPAPAQRGPNPARPLKLL